MTALMNDDDDDLGALQSLTGHGAPTPTPNNNVAATSMQGNPTSSIQATPDFSQTAQLASAPPPLPVPTMSPAELQVMQQMACQAASNAASTAGSAASAASGAAAGIAGAATTYVTLTVF